MIVELELGLGLEFDVDAIDEEVESELDGVDDVGWEVDMKKFQDLPQLLLYLGCDNQRGAPCQPDKGEKKEQIPMVSQQPHWIAKVDDGKGWRQ